MFRRLVLSLATLGLLLAAGAASADSPATAQRFGAPLKLKKSVEVARLAQAPEKFKGRTVRLEGTVQDVCQGKGCWVQVTDGKGASFMARSLDESVLLPKDCKGMHVVVEGLVTTMPKAAMEEPEPKDHACPKPEYVVSTRGVELHAAR